MRFFLYLIMMLALVGCQATQTLYCQHPRYVSSRVGQIEYYRFGQGKPIVLISGYMSDITSWNREFLSALAKHHEVIVFNNRNVGGTMMSSTQYRSQDLANDTYQLIQALHLKKPTVLGISMGGMIAQQLAVMHPEAVGRLVLINTAISGKQSVHPSKTVEAQMLHLPSNRLKSYLVVVKLFFPPQWRLQMGYALAVQRFQPRVYTEVNPLKVMMPQQQLVLDWMGDDETAKKMKHLPMPTLILNGLSDKVIPPKNSVILAKVIPHAQLLQWPEGGHAMIYQYPQGLAERIGEFIAEKETRARIRA